jgi:sugar-specific transcriptional regulator TrmB
MGAPRSVHEHLERLRQVLKELPPEDELIGNVTEEKLLEKVEAVLRGLPEEYIAALPKDLQEKIRRRLERR